MILTGVHTAPTGVNLGEGGADTEQCAACCGIFG